MKADTKEKPPFRQVAFPPVNLDVQKHSNGEVLISTQASLSIDSLIVAEQFTKSVAQRPERAAIAERKPDGDWHIKTYRQYKTDVDAVAQWLLDQGAGPQTPIMVISGNSIAHATVRFAALSIGAPIAPVSENYALLGMANGFMRLNHALDLIEPHFIFAEDERHAPAIAQCKEKTHVITSHPEHYPAHVTDFNTLLSTPVSSAVEQAIDNIDPDAPAAYMLTSGSTGKPKAVIHTNRMISHWFGGFQWIMEPSGLMQGSLLEWLPWSHVSGQYNAIAAALMGAQLYIDKGLPLPGLFDTSIRNMRDVSLSMYINVPAGYTMLAQALEKDPALCEHFFKDMRFMIFGGADLPRPIYNKLQQLAVASTGKRVLLSSGYGATETVAGFMSAYYAIEDSGLGLPTTGIKLRLIPYQDRYELRVKSNSVTPGYLKTDTVQTSLLDEQGYYRTGDAVMFNNPEQPEQGLKFAGRLSENFKLISGTWVASGALRNDLLIALAPYVSELLVCGDNREAIGILAWPSAANDATALGKISTAIQAFNKDNSGGSRTVKRFAFLTSPPDAGKGELSDKGSINQSLAITNREKEVSELYAERAGQNILCFD